ncbi:galectin-6-like [Pygocentrus nattereri]|uniref:galectin-6-like n=1 Tax=Pygocentrus nattereri TaxID=42514 RepID=UPI0018914143|nr:galectin-6-like [Pygocentrus nattereri]
MVSVPSLARAARTTPTKAMGTLFMISLKTGQFRGDDIAFRFKPCIGQRVVLNSFRNLKWESEESASDKPFTKGAPFTIIYVIKPEGYEVYVNKLKLCMFKHRIPLEKVTTLDLDGDVTFNMLGVIENWSTSSFFKEYETTTSAEISHPVSNPKIPYMGAISGGIRPGMALYFQGTVPQKADKFSINLKTGQAPGDDTAFHFNPRIGDRVALNSFSNGRWESEETASDKPFTKGKPFTMFYVIKPEGYEVYVNGFQHCLFKHRIPLEKVSALGLEGDVTINILGVIENWKKELHISQ